MRHAFDFSNLVNRHSIHEIHPHPAELSVRQVLPDLRNLLGATADFRHPVMRLLHADIRSGNRCCFLGKLVQCKGRAPQTVAKCVLDYFAGKGEEESQRYIDLCMSADKLK